jgi:rhodanese-related sulfurtransferase
MRTDAVIIVDALPAHAYAARHLPGAVNLVQDSPVEIVRSTLPEASATIVTYSTDQHCERGRDLAERLRELGYADVRHYTDGIEDWVRNDLPVETGW